MAIYAYLIRCFVVEGRALAAQGARSAQLQKFRKNWAGEARRNRGASVCWCFR